MATNSMEWVEIIEPKTGEHMYANLTTGECVWDPPEGVPVKRTDSNQWWELFDTNTARFYYYNASSQRTVWHRPGNCDIIPLAKLQTLKQNTDPENKSSVVSQATQTPSVKIASRQCYRARNHSANSNQQQQQQQQPVPLSLSASTPQLRRRASELSRSSSFVSQRQREREKCQRTNATSMTQTSHSHYKSSAPLAHDLNNSDNSVPLYSNWHEAHLLPLQHYILQQNSLSGYRAGDPIDSDTGSDHSYSGSESLTGHEPDNEDSDQSERSYVTHHTISENKSHEAEYLSHPYSTRESLESDKYLTYGFRNNYTTAATSSLPVSTANQISTTFNSCPRVEVTHNQQQTQHQQTQQQQQQQTSWITEPENYYSIAEATATPIPSAEVDMEKFAQDNLNLHSKGLFRRKVSVRDMLSWSGGSINRPMLSIAGEGKQHSKMARDMFRLIQIYMGDRKARPGMTLNSVLLEILGMSFAHPGIRDELYVQLCRQTTENPNRESLLRGWELFAIALSFIPPSTTFQSVLLGYLNRHYDPSLTRIFPDPGRGPIHVQISHYAMVAINRLERIGSSGKRKARKPASDDIDAARVQIFKTSMFGNTLTEVMNLQREKFPERQLPWAQVVLSEQILRLDGAATEGIFRVSADVDEVNTYKVKLDQWELIEPSDAHVPANLLKLWYRELYEPLIPDSLYEECVYEPMTTERATNIIARLPRINRLVLCYLVRFLQKFSQSHVVAKTKMDASNLAMVFAPNCLRCNAQDPRVIFENARKEMGFMRCLIEGLDTSGVKDLV